MPAKRTRQKGITLIELLIAVVIVAVLALILLFALSGYQGRARDSRRKADLDRIKIAFEDYYNDHGCYPPVSALDTCGSDELRPYMDKVLCDPFTKLPYVYIPDENNQCRGYRLLTNLENNEDTVIADLNCDTSCGCGYGTEYTYGVSAGIPLISNSCNPVTDPGASGTAVPSGGVGGTTPTPTPSVTLYACAPSGICNVYANPTVAGCPISYIQSNCQNQCGNSANWCAQ